MERVFRGVDIFFHFFHGRMDAWMHEWNGMGLLFHLFFFHFSFLFSSPTRWSVVLGVTYHIP